MMIRRIWTKYAILAALAPLVTGCGGSNNAPASRVETPYVSVQIANRAAAREARRAKQAARADQVEEQSSEERVEAAIRAFNEAQERERTEAGTALRDMTATRNALSNNLFAQEPFDVARLPRGGRARFGGSGTVSMLTDIFGELAMM